MTQTTTKKVILEIFKMFKESIIVIVEV